MESILFFSLCSGTSRFGSGTLGLFKPIDERNIINYSIKLYKKLQSEGYNLNIEQVGSINLAQTKDRMIALRRRMAFNIPTGLNCEVSNKLSGLPTILFSTSFDCFDYVIR